MFIVIYDFFLEKFECDTARGTRAEQHARNPRETQTRITRETRAKRRRAEPARIITTSRTNNNSSRCIVEIMLIVVLIKLRLVEVAVIFIVIYEFLQEIWMRLHARNPRKTTRADTAQNADARNARKPRKTQTGETRAYY